jgi:hypothetical protein
MRHQKSDITEGMLSLDRDDVVSAVVIECLASRSYSLLSHVRALKEQ